MSKVLIWSDAHVHPHKKSSERLQHCLDALEWVFKTAEERDIRHLLFGGDLFQTRQQIDVQTYQRTFEMFQKYMSRRPVEAYLLLGNHDLWHLERWDISSVIPLRSVPGVSVVDQPCTIRIGDSDISFLPYTHNPISDLSKIVNKSKFKILIGHIAVDGAILNVMHGTTAEVPVEHDGDIIQVGKEIFDGWDRVFLGHYHAEQKLGDNVEYVGSPLQLSFGEAFQFKHIIAYDTETDTREYIRNTFSPQHFIIPASDIPKYELKNNFIRVSVEDMTQSNLAELRNTLANEGVGSLKITKAVVKNEVDDGETIKDAKSIINKPEMLEKYVEIEDKRNNLTGLSREKLLKIGQSICSVEIEK